MARKNKNNQLSVTDATQFAAESHTVSASGKQRATASAEAKEDTFAATAAAQSPSFWKKLGGGERFAVAVVVLLFALGAFGAGMNYLE